MPVTESIGRRQCIPIIYTKGSHYEVGFDVGRTFGHIIKSFLNSCKCLHEEYLPAYNTPEGHIAYEDTLNNLKTNFPQYIQELEGTADGAQVPFHELFLMHMDDITAFAACRERKTKDGVGCTSIIVNNNNQEILGHTEDALSDTLNHFYFVSAHIVCDKPQGKWKVTEERFTSLCYAGHLPGYTMNYNHHGLVFSINTISAKCLQPGQTPRHFITRALLSAENFNQAKEILKDTGSGAADACSINMTFLNQEGERLLYNIEMAPTKPNGSRESQLSIVPIKPGEHFIHCNEFLRITQEQGNPHMLKSSQARSDVLKKYKAPTTKDDVISMLGDESHPEHRVFRDLPTDFVKTIAAGIFDCKAKTWALYSDNPRTNEPMVVLPLVLKSNK